MTIKKKGREMIEWNEKAIKTKERIRKEWGKSGKDKKCQMLREGSI